MGAGNDACSTARSASLACAGSRRSRSLISPSQLWSSSSLSRPSEQASSRTGRPKARSTWLSTGTLSAVAQSTCRSPTLFSGESWKSRPFTMKSERGISCGGLSLTTSEVLGPSRSVEHIVPSSAVIS
eukprot:scaffold94974_cov60-Phaeocystis_antarctica.AAC.5